MTRMGQKIRLRHFTRNFLSLRARREREVTLMMTSTRGTIQSAMPNAGHFGLTISRTVKLWLGSEYRKERQLKI